MQNEQRALIIERYVNNKGSYNKTRNRFGLSYEQVRYIIRRNYQGYLNPHIETETITIQSIINYDEGYYRELFKSWDDTKGDIGAFKYTPNDIDKDNKEA